MHFNAKVETRTRKGLVQAALSRRGWCSRESPAPTLHKTEVSAQEMPHWVPEGMGRGSHMRRRHIHARRPCLGQVTSPRCPSAVLAVEWVCHTINLMIRQAQKGSLAISKNSVTFRGIYVSHVQTYINEIQFRLRQSDHFVFMSGFLTSSKVQRMTGGQNTSG